MKWLMILVMASIMVLMAGTAFGANRDFLHGCVEIKAAAQAGGQPADVHLPGFVGEPAARNNPGHSNPSGPSGPPGDGPASCE